MSPVHVQLIVAPRRAAIWLVKVLVSSQRADFEKLRRRVSDRRSFQTAANQEQGLFKHGTADWRDRTVSITISRDSIEGIVDAEHAANTFIRKFMARIPVEWNLLRSAVEAMN
jgi:hypothetical protein